MLMRIGNHIYYSKIERKYIYEIEICRCSIEGLKYEQAWEVPGQIESTALSTLKSSISLKHSQSEIDHALQFFEKYVYDFPGEFFLQTPFIFTVSTPNNERLCSRH